MAITLLATKPVHMTIKLALAYHKFKTCIARGSESEKSGYALISL